jgi:hypothetical protein
MTPTRGANHPRGSLIDHKGGEIVTIRESVRPNVLTAPGVYGLESAKPAPPSPTPPTGSCSKSPGDTGAFL